jgi:hypothetical protein
VRIGAPLRVTAAMCGDVTVFLRALKLTRRSPWLPHGCNEGGVRSVRTIAEFSIRLSFRTSLATMSEEKRMLDRVTFGRGFDVCIMGIDGTWRRECQLNAISDNDAVLTVEGSIQGLNLKEFFLLLSSTGLAYRRCELVRVNGTEMDIQFLNAKASKKKAGGSPH